MEAFVAGWGCLKEDRAMPRRHELTDAQWKRIEPLLPGKHTDPGRSGEDNRRFVNAVIYVLKTGIPWADLPERDGKPNTVWKRFDRWCARGVWEEIFLALASTDPDFEWEEELAELHLDSSTVKAHQTASTGRRQPGEKSRRPTSVAASDAAAAD